MDQVSTVVDDCLPRWTRKLFSTVDFVQQFPWWKPLTSWSGVEWFEVDGSRNWNLAGPFTDTELLCDAKGLSSLGLWQGSPFPSWFIAHWSLQPLSMSSGLHYTTHRASVSLSFLSPPSFSFSETESCSGPPVSASWVLRLWAASPHLTSKLISRKINQYWNLTQTQVIHTGGDTFPSVLPLKIINLFI